MLRKQLPADERINLSGLAAGKFFKLQEIKTAKMVFCYLPTKYEISTVEIIKKLYKNNINVCCPKITGECSMEAKKIENIENIAKNIEPEESLATVSKKDIDICIMPGLAFTLSGQRLGYGKGFYDRYLENLNCIKIGLCFDFQIIDYIPVSDFDINADYIVTDKRIINCKTESVL